MIYECTDCTHCANFAYGFRIYCLHPKLPSDEVLKYQPLADKDAEDCLGFLGGESREFSWESIEEYEKWCMEKYGDITYEGVREWCEEHQR